MKIITKSRVLEAEVRRLKRKNTLIGFVPTMGALHEGHLSLVRRARAENKAVIVSIFVNPTQFAPHEDYKQYPRDLKKDSRSLSGLCDVLFVPSASDLYGKKFSTMIEVGLLGERLCGKARPGHFRGVATIVAKFFHLTGCDNAYFGQKDVQQAIIIQKMVQDLNFPVKVKVLPTRREPDGLAMSSRNNYLTKSQRRQALVLYQALKSAQRLVSTGVSDAVKIKAAVVDFIHRSAQGVSIEFVEIGEGGDLSAVKTIQSKVFLLLAVHIGQTRLIDNIVLRPAKRKG